MLEGGRSRSLEALLEFVEDSDIFDHIASKLSSGPLHRGNLAAGMTFSFALSLSPHALPSYRSEHGELYWQVHVKSDEVGRDSHERRRIAVERQRRIAES